MTDECIKKSFSQAQRIDFEIINPRDRNTLMVLSQQEDVKRYAELG